MVMKITAGAINRPVRRRDFLKGAAALGAAGAFPAMRVRIGESASSEGPDFSLLQKGATRFPGIQIFEQSRNEQLLADTLNAAQGDIRWQHRLAA